VGGGDERGLVPHHHVETKEIHIGEKKVEE